MSRVIKYRAWLIAESRMIDPVAAIDLLDPHPSISWYEDVHDAISGVTTDAPLDHVVLMQYTGLKDRNGKGREMYEGDVYKQDHRYYLIEWSEYSTGWVVRSLTSRNILPGHLKNEVAVYDDYEYVGSIHEHPHLLGGNQG